MNYRKTGRKIESIFTLLLLAIFAGAVLLILLLGVRSYRSLADRVDSAYQERTCVQYVAAKVRHNDINGNIFVDDFSDESSISALFLTQVVDDELYYTRIYYYNGYVCELFSLADETLLPEDGNNVLACSGLDFLLGGKLLEISATDNNGHVTNLTLGLRSSGEAMG